jgi:hypothetical protein
MGEGVNTAETYGLDFVAIYPLFLLIVITGMYPGFCLHEAYSYLIP